MNRTIAAIASLVLIATFAIAAPASAHTGSISNAQACDTGTVVTIHRDDNWSDTTTWRVTVRGHQVDSGTGPGDTDTWSYHVGKAAGSATFYIDFNDEHRSYSTTWPELTGCTVPRVFHPAAHIGRPCEDPKVPVTLDNRASTGKVTFHIVRHTEGDVRTSNRTLFAGQRVTKLIHADPGTTVFVSARSTLLASRVMPRHDTDGDLWWGSC